MLATCPDEKVARSLALDWAVYPVVTNVFKSTDEIVNDAKEKAIEFMNLEQNDIILITGGFYKDGKSRETNFMKIEKI